MVSVMDYLGGPSGITRVLIRETQEGLSQRRRCGNRSRDRSDVPMIRSAGSLWKLEKAGKWILPRAS